MKKMITVIAVFGLIGILGVSQAWAGRISDRQGMQRYRIVQGVRSGELTRGEVRLLSMQQRRIQQIKVRAWRDGRLTDTERLIILRMQDHASRKIHRLKHNERYRN